MLTPQLQLQWQLWGSDLHATWACALVAAAAAVKVAIAAGVEAVAVVAAEPAAVAPQPVVGEPPGQNAEPLAAMCGNTS